MRHDGYGLPVTTESSEALEAYDRGVAGVLGWHRQTIDFFREATAADPRFALAHAGLGLSLFVEERFAEARSAIGAARALAPSTSDRERSHLEALGLYVEVRMAEAERAMRAHLATYPTDLLVAQRLYFLWFFQGRFPEMLALASGLVRRLDRVSFPLGLHAFVLEEVGRCDEALAEAEACVARNPQDTWGVHALAHALYEMGRSREGLARIAPALASCRDMNYYRNHLLWHLVLMHLFEGDYQRASAMTHAVFEREPSPLALDLRNSISALWRLELCGMDVAARCQPFVEVARALIDRPEDLPFHHAHLGMVFAGGRDWPTAERHLDLLRRRSAGGRAGVLGEVVVPLVEGLHAFGQGDWRRVIDRLEPVRDRLIEIGGSRTQRDVFHDTLLEACFRGGHGDRAERYLAERLARRPDHFWVHRQVA